MNTQFKFEKQAKITNEFAFLNVTPEQVLMLDIERKMKAKKMRSFKSYLIWVDTDRLQKTSISIREISDLLNITENDADFLAVKWSNEIGGRVVSHADLYTYYFKDVYEITN